MLFIKKTVLVIITVILVAVSCLTGFAEPYTFSNGIRFGMSSDEVKTIMKNTTGADPSYEEAEGRIDACAWDHSKISKYTATAEYMFHDDSLVTVFYVGFSDDGPTTFQYLNGAYTSVYGEADDLSQDTVMQFLRSLMGDQGISIGDMSDGKSWHIDGNPIVWTYLNDRKATIIILIDETFDVSSATSYDTTNLF